MTKPFAPKVFQLGYVALECPDFERTKAHYAETIGMRQTDTGHDGEVYLSIGYEHHNIVLRKSEKKALANLGFQLQPGTDLKEMVKALAARGHSAQIKTDSQPGVRELLEVEPVPGVVFQLYPEIATPAPGFKRTGIAPLRLGHVAVISSHGEKLLQFFGEDLGFWQTDTIGGGVATFMTCNRDHHVVNVLSVPDDRVHHIAFELKGNASHAMASDALREEGVPVKWGPARHTAGHNLAGYHFDPDNVLIELYTDMDQFIPQLNMCEARPWHEHYPMQPRDWGFDELCAWETEFAFNLAHA
ncbi:MAG: VOC family protein [Rhodobacter sp.]|nr:VOC family protein [Paracoccaceae bacterium]MCC0077565.1 VOC family protein [Rhodobacter sp.]